MDKNTANGLIVVEGKTITAKDFKKKYIYNAPPPLPQINFTPYWDGQSARNKRRLAERNAKKKRK